MDQRFDCRNGNSARYFNRPPEQLVLQGYRIWTMGIARQDDAAIPEINELYRHVLGNHQFRPAVRALMDFVGTLGLCATCPLHMMHKGSDHICKDEILVMGLVAGLQHGDEDAVKLCLDGLTCSTRCDEVSLSAGCFAFMLRGCGKNLLPISADLIRTICENHQKRQADRASAASFSPNNMTLH